MNSQLKLNINKAVMEKYGALSPESNFLLELYSKVGQLEEIPDRRTIYSIEISDNLDGDGGKYKHWRWAGSLEQFEKDVKEYVACSEGRFELEGKNKIVWRGKEKIGGKVQIINFHAAKQ